MSQIMIDTDERPEAEQVGGSFSRLDPSRRSISAPSVEFIAVRAAATRAAQQAPPKPADPKQPQPEQQLKQTSPANSNNSNAAPKSTIWRRRTALGLIPLGPLNWLTGNQQQQQQPDNSSNRHAEHRELVKARKFSSLIRQKQPTSANNKQIVLTLTQTEATANKSDPGELICYA